MGCLMYKSQMSDIIFEYSELKEKLKERGENLSQEQKEKLREKMKERFEKMTPEEKAEFLKKHPELKEKLEGDKK